MSNVEDPKDFGSLAQVWIFKFLSSLNVEDPRFALYVRTIKWQVVCSACPDTGHNCFFSETVL
jgi:hypothetical protein